MKEALVLETYDEVKNAMMSGKDINFEMVIDGKVEEVIPAKEEFNIGDPYFIDGECVGVVAAVDTYVNGSKKTIVLSLKDEKEEMTWDEAMAFYKDEVHGWRLPTKEEFALIIANVEEINQSLENNNGELLDGWYWSSSENDGYNRAWVSDFGSSYGLFWDYKRNHDYREVRPVIEF